MTEQIENIIFAIVAIVAIVGVAALWRIGTWVRNLCNAIEDKPLECDHICYMPEHTAGSLFHDEAGNHDDIMR